MNLLLSKNTHLIFWLIGLLMLPSCHDENHQKIPFELKLGLVLPKTGSLELFSGPVRHGALLAIEHLTQAGYAVTLVETDDQSQPEAGVVVAQQLVQQENIPVLIGAVSSAVTIAIAEKVTIPQGVLQISPASSASNISTLTADQGKDLLFRTNLSDALQGVRLAQLAREKGFAQVSSLYVDNAYGQSINAVFTESLGQSAVAATLAHPDESMSSFVTELSKLAVKGSVALATFSYPRHIDIYVKEAFTQGFFKQFLFASGGKSKNLVAIVGAEALEGSCGTQPGLAQSDSLALFTRDYEVKFGEVPALFPYAAATYDAIVTATLAAYAAQIAGKGLTGMTIRDHLREVAGPEGVKITASLASLQDAKKLLFEGKAIDYQGASGEVDYDEVGDVVRPVEVWCYRNGEMVVKP